MKGIFTSILLLICYNSFSQEAFNDIIVFNNGHKQNCIIVEEIKDVSVKIKLPDGSLKNIDIADVAKIERAAINDEKDNKEDFYFNNTTKDEQAPPEKIVIQENKEEEKVDPIKNDEPAKPASKGYLEVAAGVKFLNVEKKTVDFVYTDESPVPDIITTRVPFKGNKIAINISLDYETFKDKKKLYGIGRLQGYVGEVSGLDIAFGAGYPIYLQREGKFRIHPEATIGFGFNKKDLGTLEVESAGSVYIQVNETRYSDYESVDVALQKVYLALRPGLKFAYKLNDKLELRLYGGYLFAVGKSSISFSGKTDTEESKEESEKLGAANVRFRVDGEETSDAPFNANGFECRIGVAFSIK